MPPNSLLKSSLSAMFWLPSACFLSQYFYNIKYITGRSMQPTLNPDSSLWRDIAIFNRYTIHALCDYSRNDIVSLRSPEDPKRTIVKRIIATEGDIVKTLPPYLDREVRVPQGHVWVEGDEPFNSDDSNHFGPVPAALLESKLVFIIWPLDRFGRLSKPSLPSRVNGPINRKSIAEFEREMARRSRVKISQ